MLRRYRTSHSGDSYLPKNCDVLSAEAIRVLLHSIHDDAGGFLPRAIFGWNYPDVFTPGAVFLVSFRVGHDALCEVWGVNVRIK